MAWSDGVDLAGSRFFLGSGTLVELVFTFSTMIFSGMCSVYYTPETGCQLECILDLRSKVTVSPLVSRTTYSAHLYLLQKVDSYDHPTNRLESAYPSRRPWQ